MACSEGMNSASAPNYSPEILGGPFTSTRPKLSADILI